MDRILRMRKIFAAQVAGIERAIRRKNGNADRIAYRPTWYLQDAANL